MPGNSLISSYGHPRYWWACLPVVPPSRASLDHWAVRSDGRTTPYQRLQRVWMDSTRFQSPSHDPDRPHEFANFSHTVCRTCAMWELLSLVNPADWYGLILPATEFRPVDCAWAYEYEGMTGEGSGFKQTDIAVHLVNAAGLERLLIIEVKRPGDKLKRNCARPDTEPSSYLDLPEFRSIPDRHLLYLVSEEYAPIVRSQVRSSDPRWSVLTWRRFWQIQHQLATLLPPPLSKLFTLCADALAFDLPAKPSPLTQTALDLIEGEVRSGERLPDHLANFAESALHFMRLRAGLPETRPPFPYLANEPSFAEIHSFGEMQRQHTCDRRLALWRLPKCVSSVTSARGHATGLAGGTLAIEAPQSSAMRSSPRNQEPPMTRSSLTSGNEVPMVEESRVSRVLICRSVADASRGGQVEEVATASLADAFTSLRRVDPAGAARIEDSSRPGCPRTPLEMPDSFRLLLVSHRNELVGVVVPTFRGGGAAQRDGVISQASGNPKDRSNLASFFGR